MNATFTPAADKDELAGLIIPQLPPAQRDALVAASPSRGAGGREVSPGMLRALAERGLAEGGPGLVLTPTGRVVADHLAEHWKTPGALTSLRTPAFIAPPGTDEAA